MSSHKLIRIFTFFLILFVFAFIGAAIIKYRNNFETDEDLIIQLLFFTSFAEIGIYYFSKEYKSKLNLNTIIFAILRIFVAILFFNRVIDLQTFCIVWGVYECIRSLVNIPKNVYIVYRHHEYLRLCEIVVSIVEFVFGVLLIIGTIEHLKGHLVAFGATLLSTGILFAIDSVLSVVKKEQRH